jgi:hypothetical protein
VFVFQAISYTYDLVIFIHNDKIVMNSCKIHWMHMHWMHFGWRKIFSLSALPLICIVIRLHHKNPFDNLLNPIKAHLNVKLWYNCISIFISTMWLRWTLERRVSSVSWRTAKMTKYHTINIHLCMIHIVKRKITISSATYSQLHIVS